MSSSKNSVCEISLHYNNSILYNNVVYGLQLVRLFVNFVPIINCLTLIIHFMAKGSFFWSTARGKVGNVVYRVRKGQEVASMHQPNVANPRTVTQIAQRIKFSVSVKFYKSAIAKMFKFAYEDKGANESDYNAFMRHNTTSAMILKRMQYDSTYYPAIGENWVMSFGSLTPHEVNAGMERPYVAAMGLTGALAGGNVKFADCTISAISNWLVTNYGYQNGDLFTIVRVDSHWSDINEELISEPAWEVVQIRCNTNNYNRYKDVYEVGTLASELVFDDAANALYLGEFKDTACGYAVIHSRQGQKLLVSTQELILNDAALNIYASSFEQPFYNEALYSWGATTDAVLQGGVADGDVSSITVGIKDLKKAKWAFGDLRSESAELSEQDAIKYWNDVVRKRPVDTKFTFKSNGVPSENQIYAPTAWPVNGVSEDDKQALGMAVFVFTEPIIDSAFKNTDFKFTYTNVDGGTVELEAYEIYSTSFNPTGTSTGTSYYALQVYLRGEKENVSTIGGIPEYNWQNCHVYYKGIYIGRVTLTWYKDPAGA